MKDRVVRFVVLAGGIFSILFYCAAGCTALQRRQTVATSLDTCIALAKAYCREDLAAACQAGKDLAPILEQLLGESNKLSQCRVR